MKGGDSSEKLSKEFRRPLSAAAKIEEFSNFTMPDDERSHLQCFLRKFPNFLESNIPFYQYVPSPEELQKNREIERRKKELPKTKGTRGRSIIFHGEPGPSGISNQNEPGPSSRQHETIEAALEAAMNEANEESEAEEFEDPVILEYIQNQIEENDQIEFVGQDQDGNDVDPVYEFLENDDEIDARFINLIPEDRQKRIRKRPSRFDDFELN